METPKESSALLRSNVPTTLNPLLITPEKQLTPMPEKKLPPVDKKSSLGFLPPLPGMDASNATQKKSSASAVQAEVSAPALKSSLEDLLDQIPDDADSIPEEINTEDDLGALDDNQRDTIGVTSPPKPFDDISPDDLVCNPRIGQCSPF